MWLVRLAVAVSLLVPEGTKAQVRERILFTAGRLEITTVNDATVAFSLSRTTVVAEYRRVFDWIAGPSRDAVDSIYLLKSRAKTGERLTDFSAPLVGLDGGGVMVYRVAEHGRLGFTVAVAEKNSVSDETTTLTQAEIGRMLIALKLATRAVALRERRAEAELARKADSAERVRKAVADSGLEIQRRHAIKRDSLRARRHAEVRPFFETIVEMRPSPTVTDWRRVRIGPRDADTFLVGDSPMVPIEYTSVDSVVTQPPGSPVKAIIYWRP